MLRIELPTNRSIKSEICCKNLHYSEFTLYLFKVKFVYWYYCTYSVSSLIKILWLKLFNTNQNLILDIFPRHFKQYKITKFNFIHFYHNIENTTWTKRIIQYNIQWWIWQIWSIRGNREGQLHGGGGDWGHPQRAGTRPFIFWSCWRLIGWDVRRRQCPAVECVLDGPCSLQIWKNAWEN